MAKSKCQDGALNPPNLLMGPPRAERETQAPRYHVWSAGTMAMEAERGRAAEADESRCAILLLGPWRWLWTIYGSRVRSGHLERLRSSQIRLPGCLSGG